MPFLVLHYEQLGLSGREIGLLTAVPPLVTWAGAALWGALADASQQYRRLLIVAIAGAMVIVVLFSTASQLWQLIPIVVAFGFFAAPIIPLVDHSLLELLADRQSRYGRIRLWGAIGFGLSPPLIGWLVGQSGLSWAFYGYLTFIFGCLIVARRLPIGAAALGGQFRQGFQTLMRNRQWIFFLFVIFISGMGMAVIHNYLFLYLAHMQASNTLMGLTLTAATVSELVVFFYAEPLLKRWGIRRMLFLSLLCQVIRLLAYSVTTTAWPVLIIQLLHGPSFALLWISSVSYAHRLAPAGIRATAQGMLSGVNFGLASAAGAFIGGVLIERIGSWMMFRWFGLWVLVGLILFALIAWRSSRPTSRPVRPVEETR